MDWRSACNLSKIREANRLAESGTGLPHRAILHGEKATITNREGNGVLESDADRFHDWEPIFPCDTITALGNVAREAPKRPDVTDRTEVAGPLEAYLGEGEW